MNKEDVAYGIRRTWALASTMGIGELFSNPSPIVPSDRFRLLATDYETTYEDLYLVSMQNSDYNILLSDFSFFQFSIAGEDQTRFAYYPNPFLGASREAILEIGELRAYVEEGIISIEEFLHKISERRSCQSPPTIRYDNAPEQYVESIHPCSHLHIGHHFGNRWPIRRILTPLAFGLIVLKYFYTDIWFSKQEFRLFGTIGPLDEFLATEKANCRVIGDNFFSPSEERLFYFT